MRMPTKGEAGYYVYSYLACMMIVGATLQAAAMLIDYAQAPVAMPLISEVGRISCVAGLLFAFRMCTAMALFELTKDAMPQRTEPTEEDRQALNSLKSQISAAMFRQANGERYDE